MEVTNNFKPAMMEFSGWIMKMISSAGVLELLISMVDAGMRQLNETGYMQ
jgi:hypothetical protein